jgi:hypothetical protein
VSSDILSILFRHGRTWIAAIHVFQAKGEGVDDRDKPGHDV